MALKTGSDVVYYHQNHIGSTVLVTSATGALLEDIAYLPYGATIADTGSVRMNHKFTGQELDPETDLYFYGARYYDPRLGRFISPDTIAPDPARPQSLNRYSYVLGNPVRYRDPSGHVAVIDDMIVGAAVGAVVGGTVAAVTGEDIKRGVLTGAISGAFGGLGSGIIGAIGSKSLLVSGAVYTAMGAGAGAVNARVSHADAGRGALWGAGLAFALAVLPIPNLQPFGPSATSPAASIANRVFNSSLAGAMVGAAQAGMTGGDVGKGAIRGAAGWALGTSVNMLVGHAIGQLASGGADPVFENGVFRYKVHFDWGGLSVSNVIIGTDEFLRNTPNYVSGRPGQSNKLEHERAHMPQETILGPAYLTGVGTSYGVGAAIGSLPGSVGWETGSHRYSQFDNGSWTNVPDY